MKGAHGAECAAIALVWLTACATSPLGRSQLLLHSSEEMDGMGIAAFQQISEAGTRAPDGVLVDYVMCVAGAITDALEGENARYDWEVVVFDDDTPNAFALPGGKIGVHTGLLAVAQDQDQLAAVIGHEVAHVLAEHGNERVSQQQAAGLVLTVAGEVVPPTLGGLLGVGAQYGVLLPYSRTHETEADLYGLDLMARAGFDPRASVPLWENMAAAGGARPVEFLSTHPAPASRIEALQERIPRAVPLYEAALLAGGRPRCGAG